MNHISKKVLFLGFLGLLLSNVPVEAVRVPTVKFGTRDVKMPTLPEKARMIMPGAPIAKFFQGWDKEALSKRAETAGKSIQAGLKSLQACIMGKKECSRAKIVALRGAVAALVAIIAAITAQKFGKPGYRPSDVPLWAEIGAEKAGRAGARFRRPATKVPEPVKMEMWTEQQRQASAAAAQD